MDWMDPAWLLDRFGTELFWISLVIIFVECGLFFPFLPGDTLLFALGLFIATEQIDVVPAGAGVEMLAAMVALSAAAFLGNVTGYEIGRGIGPPLYERDGRIIKRAYFDKTRAFFDKHGNKALVIGGSCRSSGPTSLSSPARPGWSAGGSSCGASSARCCGSSASPCSATSSASGSPRSGRTSTRRSC